MPLEYDEDGSARVYVCAEEMMLCEVSWLGCEPSHPVPEGLIGFCPVFDTLEHLKAWNEDADYTEMAKYSPRQRNEAQLA